MSGLSMSGELKTQLGNACKELAKKYGRDIEDGYVSVKNPGKYKIEKDLCGELSGACLDRKDRDDVDDMDASKEDISKLAERMEKLSKDEL